MCGVCVRVFVCVRLCACMHTCTYVGACACVCVRACAYNEFDLAVYFHSVSVANVDLIRRQTITFS